MSTSDAWKALNVGAGGWLTGIDIAADGTMLVRADTYGAFIWNGTEWQQLVTKQSMPATDVQTVAPQGVYEIRIAASDTNVLYMEYGGYVYRSGDKGQTWAKTSFAHVTENPNDAYRMDGQKMAIDPNNANVVYVGTPSDGLFVTRDGGATWQKVEALPASAQDSSGVSPGITGIAFDPTSGTTGDKTSIVYASSYGHGVFESADGGASWKALTGGPADVEFATVSSDGTYYAVGNNGTSVWHFAHGAWTELISEPTNGFHTVAVDPFNSQHIVAATPGGSLNQSFDGGATWSGTNWNTQFSSTDVPWLATTGKYMSVGGMMFDPIQPGKLWTSDGVGVWSTTVPEHMTWTTPIVWDSRSAGIQQLVANDIVVAPGGDPIVASWDRAFFDIVDPDVAATNTALPGFVAGWSLDYSASSPNYIVGLADWWGVEKSGYSTDGGKTWNTFASMPSFAGKTIGGSIAVSSPNEIVWVPTGGYAPVYTKDGGVTWNSVVLPGVTDWSGLDYAYYLDRQIITADKVQPDTFYLYYRGVYKSTDGGATWSQIYNKEISAYSQFNAKIEAVPGEAGNLFFTGGPQTAATHPVGQAFYQSSDGGQTWTAVPNVLEVKTFGFGAPATPGGYPAIYIVGWVNQVYGIWQSNDDAKTWVQIGDYPDGSLDTIKTISGDPDHYGQVYVGFGGSGYAYLPAAPVAPVITSFSPDSASPTDHVTNANHITIVGTATPGSTVALFDASIKIGTAIADSNGNWTFATGTLTDGSHAFTAKGETTSSTSDSVSLSEASLAFTVTVDTAPPPKAVISSFSQDTGIAGDGITSVKNLILTGSATAGSTIQIYDGITQIGTVVAGANGIWTFPTATLADGNHSFTAKMSDVAGNVSASDPVNVRIDSIAPNTPTVTSFSPDSNIVGDGLTNANQITLAGMAEAGSQVQVFDGKDLIGTVTATTAGTWSLTTAALIDGSHAFSAKATDAAGNVSALSSTLTVTVDTRAPTSPYLQSFSPDSSVVGDKLTNANQLTLKGTATAGVTIQVFDGAKQIATATADASGNWSIQTTKLTDGIHNFIAKGGDAAGNISTASSALTVTIDTVAPNAPTGTSFSPDTNIVGDGVTNANRITLSGKAEANSSVQIFDGATQITMLKADATGSWSFATGTLADGVHSFTSKATDASGNVGATSATLNVTVDTVAPTAPTLTAFSPDSNIVGDGITNINKITLTGAGQPGAKVYVYDSTVQIGSTTVNADGSWTFATAALADGRHTFTGKSMDEAGNTSSSASLAVTIDTTAPDAPTANSFSQDSGVVGDGITNSPRLTVTGTAAPNSRMKIYDGASLIGTPTANASGVWSFTTGLLKDGNHSFTSTATDAAGNVSAVSVALIAIVDTVAPGVPVIKAFSADSGKAGDGITNASRITLTGTAEAGGAVQLFDGSIQVGTVTANSSGAWSYTTATLADGNHSFTAKAVDAAANASALSAALKVLIDTVAPKAPVVVSDAAASGTSMNVSGTAEAGALVRLYEGATLLGTGTATANGTWTINSGNLSAGAHAFSATATDAAGNVSALSNILDPIIGTVIESTGTTTLTQAASNFYLSDGGVDILLKYSGAAVTAGQFGGFSPIAAEKTSTGFDIAWKVPGSDQYMVWSTDANGNYVANLTGTVSGASSALQSLETVVHQDLNGDGVIGQSSAQIVAPATSFQGTGSAIFVFVNDITHSAAVWEPGVGGQGSPQTGSVDPGANFAAKGDFNGDGQADLLFINDATHMISELVSSGAKTPSSFSVGAVNATAGWHFADVDDFNGDGKSDLLFVNTATNGVAVWQLDGSKIVAGPQIGVMSQGFHFASSGDFNGDGKTDLLMINDTTHEASIWQMNGAQVASKTMIGTINAAGGWEFAGIGDFNGDGKSDLLFLNGQTHGMAIWQMNGSQITASSQIGSINAGAGWHFADIGDFNGDGKSDLLFLNSTTHGVAIWQMNEGKIASSDQVAISGVGDNYVGLQSIDGSQKSALLFENSTTHAVTAFEMNSSHVMVAQQLGVINADAGWHLAV